MTTFNDLIARFGEVSFEGKQLALTQIAYPTHHDTYGARAIDADGNEYMVTWDCLDGWMEAEDESECCDWSIYEVRAL